MSDDILPQILRWAAGAPMDVSGIAEVDEERLLRLLDGHRLFPRFVSRIKAGCTDWDGAPRPHWCRRPLYIEAWTRSRAVHLEARQQMAAAQAVTAAADPRQPPVWFKGFSTYALTGDADTLRYSADLDVLAPNPQGLEDALLAQGYTRLGEPEAEHEFAMLSQRGINIELHCFSPVWAYPPELTPRDAARLTRPGEYAHTPGYFHLAGQMEYQDVLDDARRGVTPETAGLTVPAPEMAALLLCAHVFRNYIERGGFHLIYPVSLSELANVRALAQLPGFRAEHFLALAEQFGARHSVELTEHLLAAYFGVAPLPQPRPPSAFATDGVFPQSLLWWPMRVGTWAVLSPLDDQVDRDTGRVIERLGENAIFAAPEGPRHNYTALAGGRNTVERILVRSVGGRSLPLRFSVGWTETGLSFEVAALTRADEWDETMRFNFGSCYCEYEHKAGVFKTKVGPTHTYHVQGDASFEPQEEGYVFRLFLPWSALPGVSPQNGSVPMLLTVERAVGTDTLATLVPLKINRREEAP